MSTLIRDGAFARRAVLRLSLIEFWERYSFYTTFALLALYVAAPVMKGGMGWSNGQSLRFFGIYLLAVQTTPIVGGFLADRWVGKGAALRIGAGALVIGHTLLAVSAALPWLALPGGARLIDVAAHSPMILGQWATPKGLTATVAARYQLTTLSFYLAVATIAIGNGLFKPILTVVVGRLPHLNEVARTAAFTAFFVYINVGGLASVLFGGWLAQEFGWGFAFVGSALGMVVAIITMSVLDRRYLRPYLGGAKAVEPGDQSERTGEAPSAGHPRYVTGIALLLGLLVISSSISFQSYGFVSLFTAQLVSRKIAGFEIPPSWFTALNPITIMVVSPILLRLWRRGGVGSNWTTVQHFAGALILMGLGFAPLVAASMQAIGGARASPFWIMAAMVLIAMSELLYAPAALSASTRLSPTRFQILAIGTQGAAIGFGAWLSGQIGAVAFESNKALVMGLVAAAATLIAFALWTARPFFKRFGL